MQELILWFLCTMQMNGNNIHGEFQKKTGSWVGIGEHLNAFWREAV